MAKHFGFLGGIVVGVAAAVTLTGTAYAATGGSFIIGKTNYASTLTTLKNSGSAPVLALGARAGQVPLAVPSGAGKATNLNADKLDGLDSSALALRAGRFGTIESNSIALDVDEDGVYDVRAAQADCPAGSKLSGGGFEVFVTGGALASNSSTDGNGWFVMSLYDAADADDDLVAVAQCYNPRGAVAGATAQSALRRATVPTLSEDEKARVLRLVAKR